jgi:hypothetical protein
MAAALLAQSCRLGAVRRKGGLRDNLAELIR